MFGVANALFSGGALAGVVFTVLLQRRELQLQRLELELTRKELSRAAVAEEESAKQLLEQTRTQTKLLNAQLVTDRLEFFWRTYTPVTREQVDELKFHPEEYMDLGLYEARYKEDDVAIRKYIYMSMIYESLAFTRALHSHDVSDPMGRQWIETYTKDLVKSPEFLDVNDQYAEYYPEFRAYVDAIRETGVAPQERTN